MSRNNMGTIEKANAARGCCPAGIAMISQLSVFNFSVNNPPVEIPQIFAPFALASAKAESVSYVFPE